MNRRTFLQLGGAGIAAATLGCGRVVDTVEPDITHKLGELSARPHAPTGARFGAGRHALGVRSERDAELYLPAGLDPAVAAPLIVLLHGAGGGAASWRSPYEHADRLGLVLLNAQSIGPTWDLIRGGYGPDVATLDQALGITFDRCLIDSTRVAFCGFSDGASYALSLGLSNGELVTHAIAFSPGFEHRSRSQPKPLVFLAHGTGDAVLPIEVTGRRVLERLRAGGYEVTWHEFDGGHEVPAAVSRAAFDWLAA